MIPFFNTDLIASKIKPETIELNSNPIMLAILGIEPSPVAN